MEAASCNALRPVGLPKICTRSVITHSKIQFHCHSHNVRYKIQCAYNYYYVCLCQLKYVVGCIKKQQNLVVEINKTLLGM